MVGTADWEVDRGAAGADQSAAPAKQLSHKSGRDEIGDAYRPVSAQRLRCEVGRRSLYARGPAECGNRVVSGE